MQLNDCQREVTRQILDSPELGSLVSSEKFLQFAVNGLSEECGEVSGLATRDCYRKHPQPEERWVEELGDVFWYLCAVAYAKGITLEEIWETNYRKLSERYGFSEQNDG